MAMDPTELAELINKEISSSISEPILTTTEMTVYAKAVISTLKAASVANLPGTVEGTAPGAPGPISDLKADMGIFQPNLQDSVWVGVMAAFGSAGPLIEQEAKASVNYIQSAATVIFTTGTMQGNSTAAPGSPGIVAAGGGTGGKIKGLDGGAWALASLFNGADPEFTKKIYTVIANYIMAKGEVLYPPGSIIGQIAAPGSKITLGAATGGIVS